MQFTSQFIPIQKDAVHDEARRRFDEGWRLSNVHAALDEDGTSVYYTYERGGTFENLHVAGITASDSLPSITDVYFSAFVFENETRELFGVDIRDIALDFGGNLYTLGESEPMTFITPEQKAARDKARKAARAREERARAAAAATTSAARGGAEQAAKAHPAGDASAVDPSGEFEPSAELLAQIAAKTAGLDPERAEKVRAGMIARAARAAAKVQAETTVGTDAAAPSARGAREGA
ncbi:NADH-quinone oxidoreductase subunit C [Eggerthellaceae bacterium zg-1084]|uniref:NADH-quinone oxidoreductase subunit C n=1 Tax=Berryella wangjianweii TaxID=2734634 RepID=A0A6M8IW98_9ACTN|nr:NADH-quinone oxidoreductase subunit C [Berryella wangjianweii]NPD31423.1 NADH-quinone oxidoreductase subunit C [Berryella wangjianweii]NPD32270.1 NADH-quinone oxidoreductase subunit C [Eggerthellaceae bacterium zg-997]QKF06955.1 NADH-quinone oxidoreductase subunit C [Berryella wangjianweii]